MDILLWLTKDVGPHSEMIRGLIEQYKKISTSSVNTHGSQERHDDQNRLPHEPIYAKSKWLSTFTSRRKGIGAVGWT